MSSIKDQSLADQVAKLTLAQEVQENPTAEDSSKDINSTPATSTPGASRRAAAGYLPPHRRPKQQQALHTQAIAAPSQQYNTAASSQLNANALSFAPPVQQNSESVVHQALYERLGINKAARYSQNSSVPVPAAPPGDKKKKEKRVRKSKREKALERIAAAGEPDALTSLDLWARVPVPGEQLDEVNVPKEKQKAEPVISTAPAPAPPAKKKFNPRETKRQHVMQRPVPNPNYLYYATQAPQTLDFSRPLLVILDLNGTLLFRKTYGGSNAFTPRPHVYEFLEYLFSNHTVMVWSSSKPENVAKMCSDLFTPEQRSKLAAVWARDKLRLPAAAYHSKVQVYKQLSWVWEDPAIQASIPIPGGVWTQANTVLIDDSFEKSASEPHNQIELEEFMAKPEQMTTNVLGEVARYLDTLRSQRDVSAYMRLYPFFYDPLQQSQVGRQESSQQNRQDIRQDMRSSREEDIDELIKRVTGGR
ncbi:hypothetical protein PRZ48_002974 [Zasmidium cellare]|uniref:Mitochondrial import inner membrane translocase subunit TIM50 n=1 Tax=Zasmidium cellare TaxID=395010 RepID=A0ABR0EV96_ZASCE|nr:hypothetical protein PRZ48_002974 [Zasmidium cellare]